MKNITWQLGKTASLTGAGKWQVGTWMCLCLCSTVWAAQSLIIDKDATLVPCPRCSRPAPITLLLLRLTQSQLRPQLGLLFHSRGDWCQQIVSSSCLSMFMLLMQKSEGWSIQFIIINLFIQWHDMAYIFWKYNFMVMMNIRKGFLLHYW